MGGTVASFESSHLSLLVENSSCICSHTGVKLRQLLMSFPRALLVRYGHFDSILRDDGATSRFCLQSHPTQASAVFARRNNCSRFLF